jgi:3-oxoacyl-[acyl-carrier-protein] synthase II
MNINGIGIVFNRGRGIKSLENALNQGWQKPAEAEGSHSKGKKSLAYQVDLQTISDRTLLKKMRRADKLSKMAVLSASDAIKDSGIENIHGKKMGIIIATAFGAHVTTFDFLNDILDYGEANVSPTTFSNSVHNAAASYISSALNIQGPTLTVTQFFFPFHYALQLAQAWLNEKRCDYVLVGAVEQYGDVLGYIYDCKLTPASDGRIMPFNFNKSCHVPGEGAVCFLISKEDSKNVFCEVESILINENSRYINSGSQDMKIRHSRSMLSGNPENIGFRVKPGMTNTYLSNCNNNIVQADINIIDTDGLLPDESVYISSISPDIPTASYSPLFGSMMSGSAFNCAAGALMLKNRMMYSNPILNNPHGLNIVDETKNADIELIQCIRYNCFNEKAAIYLRKK